MSLIIMLLISSAALLAFAICAIVWGEEHNRDGIMAVGVLAAALFTIAAIAFLILVPMWYSAKVEAKVINVTFGESYTADQMFWAGSMTKEILRQKMQTIMNRYEVTIPPKLLEMIK